MAKRSREDARLVRLTKIASKLPDTTRWYNGQHAAFRVRKKTYAYFLDDHHGDGMVALNCKVLPGDNKRLVDAQPKRFHLPKYLAKNGWVGLRLDVGKIDWEEVSELVRGSYQMIAPKKLAGMVGE
jgi:phosphoribosylglycinamide formyltransferase-1